MALPLPEVFPDEDYRFHLTLRAADCAEFFRGTTDDILAERQRWLASDPARYIGWTAGAEPLLEELESLARQWSGAAVSTTPPLSAPIERLRRLGSALEPDFLLLAPDSDGTFRLRAGVVCFPSAWALEEKIGQTLDAIHGPVPTLNVSLGASISRFLARLKPGVAFERANWGLAATPELNLHPAIPRPRLTESTPRHHIWVRIEDQLLAALPGGRVLFGIRLRLVPLTDVLADRGLQPRFLRALATMPDDVARYKGLAGIRVGRVAQ